MVALVVVGIVGAAAAEEGAPEVIEPAIVGATTGAEAEASLAGEARAPARLNYREELKRGLKSFQVSVGPTWQHEMPTGPRSDLEGERLQVARRRFRTPRVEKGLELSLTVLDNDKVSTKAWELVYDRRQYFRVRPSYAAFWNVGIGLCHLTDLVPEQASHTNFVEQVGVGLMRRAGSRSAWSVEYRFTHISDGGRREPNVGVNCSNLLVGWNLYF